ncbi:unnamed protein product [Ilex paraguariensis]|uniref:Uncharacterized protein n=1 Tax=Ilex paraguariensis TaxID=185542 RepID=A0ABC8QTF7_9AQUA
MKYRSPEAKVYASTMEAKPHKLFDAPPYDNIYVTAHGFEALVPKAPKKVQAVDHKHATEYGKKCNHKHATEYDKNCNQKVYEEDINVEAEEFIELEHEKFELSK